MRTQPVDIHVHDTNEFTDQFGWSDDGIVPTAAWLDWVIYQPGQQVIIDFADANGHQDAGNGMNAAQDSTVLTDQDVWSSSGTFTITEDPVHFPEGHHESVDKITTDIVCEHRAEERKINDVKTETMISSKMTVYNSNNNIVSEFTNCAGDSPELPVGTYTYQMDVEITGPLALNDTMMKEINLEIAAFQPLLLWSSSAPASLEGKTVNLSNGAEMALGGTNYGEVNNPSYHMNPKSLDAKLIYAMFIPCLTFGAMVFILLRSMARGYEFEMNKCYGCDLCDDACPVRLFNGGDKLNIIYNSWNNEDDGVPLYSCLTCTACTNACPQLVDYDSYVDIRRGLIVGGPQAEIPHTVLQAVLAAEAEEEADSDFISVEDYPVESNIGYYPGCVDYLDQEMVFSHVNEGDMNLGDATTSAFTIFDEIGVDVSYLGRDFLKCCGHDQKWQGLTEVFDKLKAYNQKKIQQSGIDTLVSSCAECFRTFARDYELEDVKVMHTTEFLIEQGFDMNLKVEEETTVTYHDPCRLGRQMGVYDEPRELIQSVEGVSIVEMEHSGEDAMCCGVSSMMSCNENARALRVARMEEIKSTGADTMLTSCPKCVSHFECLKFEGDERYSDIKILDVVSFLAQQINEKKEKIGQDSVKTVETEA
jgi:Fe-S oxidoreductase